MNRIIRFFERFVFWIQYSRYLGCKHCCINCKFYHTCKLEALEETKEIEDYLDFKTKL